MFLQRPKELKRVSDAAQGLAGGKTLLGACNLEGERWTRALHARDSTALG